MISFGAAKVRFRKMTQDASPAALAFFEESYNIGQRILEAEIGSYWTEETEEIDTEENVSEYKTPDRFLRLKDAFFIKGGREYPMTEIIDEDDWRDLNASSNTATGNSDFAIFIRKDTFETYPKAGEDGNTFKLRYEPYGMDLSEDDHTDGFISGITNGSKIVQGATPNWDASMIGNWLQLGSFKTWYEIADVTDADTLVLDKKYSGRTVVAGSEAYKIGQMPKTPEGTHQIPIHYALMDYYAGFKQNATKMKEWKSMYEMDMARAKVTYKRRVTSNYIPGNRHRRRRFNTNYPPENMGNT